MDFQRARPPHTISIHAAREGGDPKAKFGDAVFIISIHAAREGGDVFVNQPEAGYPIFQSTPPVKAATSCCKPNFAFYHISIHAAREGGDFARKPCKGRSCHFNPRRP